MKIYEIGDWSYPGLHLYCRFDYYIEPYEESVNRIIYGYGYLEPENKYDLKGR